MSSRQGNKYYVVWQGIEPGVYYSWEECLRQVRNVEGARYKSFTSESEALRAFEDGADAFYRKAKQALSYSSGSDAPIPIALSVDAACSGNPGVLEYRGVMVNSHQEIFRIGPFPKGTNNIGEFLAIVHALAFLKQRNSNIPIYSDSITALGWIRKKQCKTLLQRSHETEALLNLVSRAEDWLHRNTYTNPIYKWETEKWGEIPADFGRK